MKSEQPPGTSPQLLTTMKAHLKEAYAVILPKPLKPERISHLIHDKGIDPTIAAIDLEMVKSKLMETEEGLGWTREQCEANEVEYKRYLHLCKLHGKGMVPTKAIDQFWHYHILDTRAYHEDCQAVYGHYLHHFPYLGMRGEEDERQLEAGFNRTARLYREAFDEDMSAPDATDCWHDCSGRCWHECSNS